MLKELIQKMEETIGTDDFELIMEDCTMQIEETGLGIEAVTPLLQLMERHPLDDFGMPGAIVHFVETFYKNGYEELLLESIKRRPTMHTTWMLNRIMNADKENKEYFDAMKGILERSDVEEAIRNSAREFLDIH